MSHLSSFPLASPAVLQATATPQLAQGTLERARAFARALIESEQLDTGENVWQHADAVAASPTAHREAETAKAHRG